MENGNFIIPLCQQREPINRRKGKEQKLTDFVRELSPLPAAGSLKEGAKKAEKG